MRGYNVLKETPNVIEVKVGSEIVYRLFGVFIPFGRRNIPVNVSVSGSGSPHEFLVKVQLARIASITPRLDREFDALAEISGRVFERLRD